MIEIIEANRVRMQLQACQVCHPQKRGGVSRNDFFSSPSRRKVQGDDVNPVGAGLRGALLKKEFAVNAVRIAHEHVRPVAGGAQGAIRHREIVAGEVELRVSALRKEYFTGI